MPREIKTIKIHPNKESDTIYAYQCFGWSLMSSQEVYSKDSHLENRFSTLYSVTETTHYVKLTFERDATSLRNIQKLRELENLYNSVRDPKKPWVYDRHPALTMAQVVVICVSGLTILLDGSARSADTFWGCLGIGLFVALLQVGKKYILKKNKEWNAACQKNREKRRKIAERAYPLLDK